MGANAKVVKRRIKSIANTMKITKAMELVAASKMRRATMAVVDTRPFAKLSWQTIKSIAQYAPSVSHPLIEENEQAEKILLVLFTSDRGLAGGYNANVIKKAIQLLRDNKGIPFDLISIGKRGNAALSKKKVNVIANFEGLTNKPTFKDVLPIAKMIVDGYSEGKYKKVVIAYTDYISGLEQKARLLELLPFGGPDEELGSVSKKDKNVNGNGIYEYTFEPNAQEVFNRTLPRLVETMVYQALLEATASEHSARMMAMRNASDAAGEMLEELRFTYNRIRQAGITQEIAEISTGKAALETANN
ncbi:ATP synthase F1 subunit gamma [Candidatus Parcubacteria bacterium]|nr:MAG: ATP synthase F1 subunit gamma [Candidatus Parcubacteria bacterium]